MAKRILIYPYNTASASCKALRTEMKRRLPEDATVMILKREGSNYKYKAGDVVINWGCSVIENPEIIKADQVGAVVNSPDAVWKFSNKLTFFNHCEDEGFEFIPEYTTNYQGACDLINDGSTIVCRTKLNGHSGEGIVIATTEDDVVGAPLYTVYQKKTDEYRVHIINRKIVKCSRKGRLREVPDDQVNWQVRNKANGFAYSGDVELPEDVLDCVNSFVDTVKNTPLMYALDVIYHKPTKVAMVLEANTAPGLMGTTTEQYARGLLEYMGNV